jgi:ribosomal-protein-alanine N-acetyltransferase
MIASVGSSFGGDEMRQSPPRLIGERVVVRPGRRKDSPAIASFYRLNDLHLSRHETPKPRSFLTEIYWEQELARRLEAIRRDHSYRLFAFDKDGSQLGSATAVIGHASLTSVVRGVFHGATLGYSLDERVQGKGLMHETLSLVLDYAFGDLNLHRVMANYSPQNLRSARVLRRLGFQVEGYAEHYLFINGAWEPHVLTARTNPAWRSTPGLLLRDDDGRIAEVPTGRRP